jgi:hypothetical protein
VSEDLVNRIKDAKKAIAENSLILFNARLDALGGDKDKLERFLSGDEYLIGPSQSESEKNKNCGGGTNCNNVFGCIKMA